MLIWVTQRISRDALKNYFIPRNKLTKKHNKQANNAVEVCNKYAMMAVVVVKVEGEMGGGNPVHIARERILG